MAQPTAGGRVYSVGQRGPEFFRVKEGGTKFFLKGDQNRSSQFSHHMDSIWVVSLYLYDGSFMVGGTRIFSLEA